MSHSLVYITAANVAQAMEIGRVLVGDRLVACANVADGVTSIYWWDGKLTEDQETVLVCKTRTALVERVVARVKSVHSYTCPCVTAISLQGGNPDYLAWIDQETVLPGD